MFKKISFICMFLILVNPKANAFDTLARYAVLIDATTNEILFEKDAHEKMAPSSMSKMMTVYVVLDALKKGEINLSDIVFHSENAWKQEGSRMFIPLGQQITVDELLKGIIIQSGNDAAVSIAEFLSGSEQEFANRMNIYSNKLNLLNSSFVNATGLPNDNHYTTAYDLAKIAQSTIQDFPEYYSLYSEKSYTYNGIKQANRNILLSRFEGVDGLKTGHTDKAGYGLTSSVVKDGRRLIAVVNGLNTNKIAAQESEKLLKYGYSHYIITKIATSGEVVGETVVKNADKNKLEIVTLKDIIINSERAKDVKFTYKLNIRPNLEAPIAHEEEVGKIEIFNEEQKLIKEFPAYAKYEVNKAGFLKRVIYQLKGLFS